MNPTLNGRKRPSLSEQIERLDAILDGLADALNGAVASAVQDAVGLAVRQAVQAVMTEVLANPEVLARMRAQGPAAAPMAKVARPGLKEHLARAGAAGRGAVRAGCGHAARVLRPGLLAAAATLRLAVQFRRPLGAALAVGAAMALTAYWAGPWLAAAASGVGGFCTALAGQVGLWLRRTIRAPVLARANG